jgi:hypothetical protein
MYFPISEKLLARPPGREVQTTIVANAAHYLNDIGYPF